MLFPIVGPSFATIVVLNTIVAIVYVCLGICSSIRLVLAPTFVQPIVQETHALITTIVVNVCKLQRGDARVRGFTIFDGYNTIIVSPMNIQY